MQATWKPLLAEAIGTFALIFIGAGAIITDAVTKGHVGVLGIALAHGLAIAVMVSALGAISGGHFNPAVTCGFLAAGRVTGAQAVRYILAQLLGAIIAAEALRMSYPHAAAAAVHLGTPALRPGLRKGRARDVEVGPGRGADKLAEKGRRPLRAPGPPRRRVLEVGDLSAHGVEEFLVERQLPDLLAGQGRRLEDPVHERLIVAHEPCGPITERHDTRAGQRGEVDDFIGFFPHRIGQGIGEDEPSLRAGLGDRARLPAETDRQ